MKKTVRIESNVRGSMDGAKTKRSKRVAKAAEAVKFFFVGDDGKPLELDVSQELKTLMFMF